MKLNQILTFFTPRDRQFHELFAQATANMVEVANALHELFRIPEPEARGAACNRVKELERDGDEVTRRIFRELSTNFITPFDREDIHYLASTFDAIVDHLNDAAQRLQIFKIKKANDSMIALAGLAEEQILTIQSAMEALRRHDYTTVEIEVAKINQLEKDADYVYQKRLGTLFDESTDAIELIREKDVLDNLENATDKCKEAGAVIESIMIKYS